jgi:hypothetical protein
MCGFSTGCGMNFGGSIHAAWHEPVQVQAFIDGRIWADAYKHK